MKVGEGEPISLTPCACIVPSLDHWRCGSVVRAAPAEGGTLGFPPPRGGGAAILIAQSPPLVLPPRLVRARRATQTPGTERGRRGNGAQRVEGQNSARGGADFYFICTRTLLWRLRELGVRRVLMSGRPASRVPRARAFFNARVVRMVLSFCTGSYSQAPSLHLCSA